MVSFVGKDSLRRPKNIIEQEKYALTKVKELESVIIKYDNIANEKNIFKILGTLYSKNIEKYSIYFDTYHIRIFENEEEKIEQYRSFFKNNKKEPKFNADVICYLKRLKEELIPLVENIDTKIDWEYGGSDFFFSYS